MVNILKEKLIEEIKKLPEDRVQEVLDYVSYLRTKEAKEVLERAQESLDPQKDPILNFIGGVSHGSLAHEIDKELYGL
jgi:ElaB/YqjD/DUF883 family membrane-anchored ribosome-binding protein